MAAYSAIDDSSAHFQVLTYRGNSTSTTSADRTLTNDGNSDLQPDLVALWNRDSANNAGARWWDSTRGVGQNKGLTSSGSNAEGGPNDPEFGYINTLHSDGFGVRQGTAGSNTRITTDRGEGGGDRYVAMQWKANGGSTTNYTGGNINSVVQADTTSGFSIVTYTGNGSAGQSVNHGLGAIPATIFVKRRDGTQDWFVYHQTRGNTMHLHLNTTAAAATTSDWGNTSPTSTDFYVNNTGPNVSTDTYVAYCFAEVQGFSRFGGYKGNGIHNGIFCYCGFKPAMVIIKNTDQTEPWLMYDNERPGYNETNLKLGAGSYATENAVSGAGDSAYNEIDIYSNGFKMTSNNGSTNADDKNFVFFAWAANPLVTSGGVPSVGF